MRKLLCVLISSLKRWGGAFGSACAEFALTAPCTLRPDAQYRSRALYGPHLRLTRAGQSVDFVSRRFRARRGRERLFDIRQKHICPGRNTCRIARIGPPPRGRRPYPIAPRTAIGNDPLAL